MRNDRGYEGHAKSRMSRGAPRSLYRRGFWRERTFSRRAMPALCALMASFGIAACGSNESSVTTTTRQHHLMPSAHVTLSLYWIRGGEALGVSRRSFPTTESTGSTALHALLVGPNRAESAAGLASVIPRGSKLRSLSIHNGIATANFNSTFASGGGSFSVSARIAQVVFTLTQFSTVKTVLFELNGVKVTTFSNEGLVLDHPLGRVDETGLLPPIFIEEPAVGDTISSPMYLAGLSNTSEAVFQVQVIDVQGHLVANDQVKTTAGTGTWGSFETRVHLSSPAAGPGKVVAYEISARGGSRIHQIEFPVMIRS